MGVLQASKSALTSLEFETSRFGTPLVKPAWLALVVGLADPATRLGRLWESAEPILLLLHTKQMNFLASAFL